MGWSSGPTGKHLTRSFCVLSTWLGHCVSLHFPHFPLERVLNNDPGSWYVVVLRAAGSSRAHFTCRNAVRCIILIAISPIPSVYILSMCWPQIMHVVSPERPKQLHRCPWTLELPALPFYLLAHITQPQTRGWNWCPCRDIIYGWDLRVWAGCLSSVIDGKELFKIWKNP